MGNLKIKLLLLLTILLVNTNTSNANPLHVNESNNYKEFKIAKLIPLQCNVVGNDSGKCTESHIGFDNSHPNSIVDTVAMCNNDGYAATSCPAYYDTPTACPYNHTYLNCGEINTGAQCGLDGYTSTSCASYYTNATTCPHNSSYYNCGTANTVSQCNLAGYTSTSCASYYTNATTCPYNSSYYNCGVANTATQCGLEGYTATSCSSYSNATTCPYDSGYFNCGPETCDSYLNSQGGVSVVMSDADITTAMASSNATVAVLADVSLPDNINLGTKKLVGPKYFTASSLCTSMSTPTLTSPGKTIDLGSSGTVKQLNVALTGGSYSSHYFTGNGTIDSVDIASDGTGYVFYLDGDTINLLGTINLVGSYTSGSSMYTSILNSSKLYVNGPLNVSGPTSLSVTVDASTLEVKSTGNLKYTGSSGYSFIEAKNGSTLTFNGPITMPSLNTGGNTYYSGKGFYAPFYLWHATKLYLNASGNTIRGSGYGIYASSSSTTGGRVEINGSTTITMDGTGQKTAFKIDHGNYNNPAGYNVVITAPVSISGLTTYSGSYAISQADHMFYLLDATLDISSTVSNSGTGAYIRNIRGSFEFRNGSYISGVDNVYSDIYVNSGGTPKINIYTGAKIKIGSTCKKATANKTYVGTSTTAYEATWTSPPSPYTGGC